MTGLAAKVALGSIPRPVLYAIGGAAIIAGGTLLHGCEVRKHDKVLIDKTRIEEDKKLEALAKALKAKADALLVSASKLERAKFDAKRTSIATTVTSTILRGPGKARCTSFPVAPAPASGPKPTSGTGNAPVASVPSGGGPDLIALPFDDTIRFGGQCDLERAENLAWRDFYSGLGKVLKGN